MTLDEIRSALSEPFDGSEVKWKPQAVSKDQTRALAVAYVDARAVMDRLDAVLGVAGWQDTYTVLPHGCVECRLSILVDGQWVTRADVGAPSDQPDPADKLKASYSDALKRCAVKFGVGRYIYRIPQQWCSYDTRTKTFTQTPRLPPPAHIRRPVASSPPPAQRPNNGPVEAAGVPQNGRSADRVVTMAPVDNRPLDDVMDDVNALIEAKGVTPSQYVRMCEVKYPTLDVHNADTYTIEIASDLLDRLRRYVPKDVSTPPPTPALAVYPEADGDDLSDHPDHGHRGA